MAVIHAEEDAEDWAAKRPAKPRAANRGSLPKHLPRIEEVTDLDDDRPYPVIVGSYDATPSWGRHPVTAGTPVPKPAPAFVKLDESVVDEELERLQQS